MKNLIIFGFFILILVFAQFAQGQTVDEVLNKHVEALGGKENLSKIKNIVMEGSLNYQGADRNAPYCQLGASVYPAHALHSVLFMDTT